MTIHPTVWSCIPTTTAEPARAAFPKGNRYLTLADHLGTCFHDPTFADLYVHHGRPAESPARLALVLVLAHLEELSDGAAAEAVRARLDWKYLLALPLDDPGFDASILTDFRARLLQHGAEDRLLTRVLEVAQAAGLLKARGRQRTDATHVLAHLRQRSRLELVIETMRAALNDLATSAPAWLRPVVQEGWADRYTRAADDYRLPRAAAERDALALTVGQDGQALLAALTAAATPDALRDRAAVTTLRAVWAQQYVLTPTLRWRPTADLPPQAALINSPYERDARFGTKRAESWIGYKVHVTETCDADAPHLITDVQTTPATTPDSTMTRSIQQALADRNLLPREHLVDSAYVTAEDLVASQTDHQIDLVGPTPADTSWQARQADGLDVSQFTLDWAAGVAICPAGHASIAPRPPSAAAEPAPQEPTPQEPTPAVTVFRWAQATCMACPLRARCTQSPTQPRKLKVRAQAAFAALTAARERQTTAVFRAAYAARAGIEGTLSQGVRAVGMRVSRYTSQAKTHLQHILIAVAINLVRLAAWWRGETPRTTRQSAFARFMLNLPAAAR